MNPPHSPFEILIAEDNSGDILLVREMLEQQDWLFNLRVVSDGAEAIRLIEQLDREPQPRLDLVLMDMHLPKYDGTQILERLRASQHLSDTPVIVLSGLTAHQLHAETARFAPVHHFTKPADFHEYMKLGTLVSSILMPKMRVQPEVLAPKTGGETA